MSFSYLVCIYLFISHSSSTSMSIRIYWTHFTTSLAASSGSRVLHSPYCPLSRMYFFTQTECFRLFFSNKLAAPKLHAIVIKEPTTISVSSAIFKKRSGFSRRVFLGKSTTKSGRARVVEFSKKQTMSETLSETRDANTCLVGSGPVGSV